MAGILYGVSVGPGDPELMTVKAVRLIKQCGVIAVPQTKGENTMALSIVRQAVDLSEKEIVYLDFLMTKDREKLFENYGALARKLSGYLEKGRDVALVSIGDISVYSTFSYIMDEVRKLGYKASMCPGVTSFCAGASAAGIPLVSGGQALTVSPGQNPELEHVLKRDGVKVIMKSGKRFGAVEDLIVKVCPDAQVTVVENCGLENERIVKGLKSGQEYGYFTLFIVQ